MKRIFTRISLFALMMFATFYLGSFSVYGQTGNAYSDAGKLVPTVTSDQDDYSPGQTAHITGYGWTLDDSVHVEFKESPDYPDYHIYDIAVNTDGTWQIDYAIEQRHLGVTFTVVAKAKTTGYLSQTIFTDAASSVTIGTQSLTPVLTYGTGGMVTFPITLKGFNTTPAPILTVTNLPNNVNTIYGAFISGQGNTLVSTLSITTSNTTSVPSGPFTVTATQSTTSASYNTGNLTINKANSLFSNLTANQTINYGTSSITLAGKVVSGAGNPTGTVTATINGVTSSPAIVNTSSGTFSITFNTANINASTNAYPITYAYSGDNNFASKSDASTSLTVNKANQTITFAALTAKNYGDASFTLGATASSGLAVSYTSSNTSVATVSGNTVTIVGAGSTTITASQSGNTNYSAATNVAQTLTVNPASQTITFATLAAKTYGNAPFTLGATASSGLAVSYASSNTSVATVSGNTVTIVGAGSTTITANQSGNTNYSAATNVAQPLTVDKANTTVTITPYSVTYDGSAHIATATVTGAKGEALTGMDLTGTTHTSAGTYATDVWTFTDVTGNYNNKSGIISDAISKADATIKITPYSVTYDATAHTASASATGVSSEALSGLTLTSSHTEAGTYTDSYSFKDVTGNYNDVASTSITDKIAQATATVNVNGYSGTYDAASHGATGTATGVGGVDLAASLSLGSAFTNVPGGTATWNFTNPNYVSQNGSASIVIDKADATIKVTPYSVTYDATAHTASASATGVSSEALSGLTITSSHTEAGTYTDSYNFKDVTGNYNDVASTSITDKIAQAAATVNVNGYSGTYDAASHGATGTATGVGGVDLAASLSLGSAFTNVPGGTATWSFNNPNYVSQNGSASIVIDKANATIKVTPYSVTYDATAHTASASATGVSSEALSGLTLTSSHTEAGTYTDSYSFKDVTGNYNDVASTSITDKIAQATATVNVNGYSGTYDAASHGATGTATGVGGVDLAASLSLGSAFTNVPGGTATWNFTNPNYVSQNGSASIVIDKADATIKVTPYSVTYDGNTHTATGTITGVKGETLAGLDLSKTTHTNAASYTTDDYSFKDVTGNYNDASGTVSDAIGKAKPAITVNGYTGIYNGTAHGATGYATGVKSENLSGFNPGLSFTNVPGGTANWAYTDATGNYNNATGTAAIVISQANQVITWNNPADITFGASLNANQLNATVGGVTGGSSTGSVTYAPAMGTILNAGQAQSITVNVAATNNYNAATQTVKINVKQAATSITTTNASGTQGGYTTLTATLTDVSNTVALNGKTVNFYVNGVKAGSALTNASGTASFTANACAAGSIQAFFTGEANYLTSSSSTATLTVATPTYVWSGSNVTVIPQPLPGGGLVITPTVAFAGLTLKNVSIDWNDGKTSAVVAGPITGSYSLGSHTYALPGAYAPRVIGTDVCGNPITIIFEYIVIYDPNAGFVTGGGWINSPVVPSLKYMTVSGKANFGFVSKYEKGQSVPTGNTQFQFQEGNMNFNSTSYDWLTIAGSKAQYKGTGSINGTGNYGFMLTGVDGNLPGSGSGSDLFRIKIWDKATGIAVYDNQAANSDTSNVTGSPSTILGGGSIVIHSTSNGNITTRTEASIVAKPTIEVEEFTMKAYPNPSTRYFTLNVKSPSSAKMQLQVFDMSGRQVHSDVGSANQTYRFGDNFSSGTYVIKVVQGDRQSTLKVVKLK